MKERPIILTAQEVQAVREGGEVEIRRPMKPQPGEGWEPYSYQYLQRYHNGSICAPNSKRDRWGVCNADGDEGFFSPFGAPGDRLWVREAWAVYARCQNGPAYCYRADGDLSGVEWEACIHMPRNASRLTLEILDVRVEPNPWVWVAKVQSIAKKGIGA